MKNLLKETLDAVLLERGFTRKALTWFAESPETIVVVNLQKSQWGEQYYVNLAVWVKALGESKAPPKEQLCHVRIRLTSLADHRVEDALDLTSNQLKDAERKQIVESYLVHAALPFLDECRTVKDLARLYCSGKLGKAMVHKNLKQLLSA